MKPQFLARMLFVLGVSLNAFAASPSVSFPGTGLQIVPPPGMNPSASGTTLIDDVGETVIVFTMGDPKYNLENNPTWRQLYKNTPERISLKNISGNLYRRTRANDGGGWDGWYFSAVRGDRGLTVMASYTGNSPDKFDRIRSSLLSIVWDDSKSDPELSMGAKMEPSGLRVVPSSFGAIAYTVNGQFGAPGPRILVQALPLPSHKAKQVFPSGCGDMLSAGFPNRIMSGPNAVDSGGVRYCEGWGKIVEPEMRYMATVQLPNGGLLTVMATASSSQFSEMLPKFQSALRGLKPFPR